MAEPTIIVPKQNVTLKLLVNDQVRLVDVPLGENAPLPPPPPPPPPGDATARIWFSNGQPDAVDGQVVGVNWEATGGVQWVMSSPYASHNTEPVNVDRKYLVKGAVGSDFWVKIQVLDAQQKVLAEATASVKVVPPPGPDVTLAFEDKIALTGIGWERYPGNGILRPFWYAPADMNVSATWTFAVTPGKYKVAATWLERPNRAMTSYMVYDGGARTAERTIDQKLPPADFRDGGIGWGMIGEADIAGTTLEVRLAGGSGYICADAVRLEKVGAPEPPPDPEPGPADLAGVTLDCDTAALNSLYIGYPDKPFKIEHDDQGNAPAQFWPQANIWNVKNDLWGKSSTWNLNRVPQDGDNVSVNGLAFDVSASRRLRAKTVIHNEGAVFQVGSDERPVPARTKIDILLLGGEYEPNDPKRLSRGLLSTGKMTVRCERLPDAYGHVNHDIPAGADKITFDRDPKDWHVGGEVVIADTHLPTGRDANGPPLPYEAGYQTQTERRQIVALELDLTTGVGTYTLDRPLNFTHSPTRDEAGNVLLPVRVGYLTHDVTVESLAEGQHHVMFGHSAEPSLHGVAFRGVGVTTGDPISAQNIMGRYALHLHNCHGATPPDLRSVSVYSDTPDNPRKWGLTVHGTHNGTYEELCVYNYTGWGIGEEDGSETGNTYTRCLAIAIRSGGAQSHERGDQRGLDQLGWNGNGFWFRGAGAKLRDCEAADCIIGLNVWLYGISQFVKGPHGQQFEPRLVPLDWQGIRAGGGRTFVGVEDWYHGLRHDTPLPDPRAPQNVIEDVVIAGCIDRGYYNYVTNNLFFKDWVVADCRLAISGTDYAFHNLLIDGLRAVRCRTVFTPSTVGEKQELRNASFEQCNIGVYLGDRWGVPGCEKAPPRRVVLRNVRGDGTTHLVYKTVHDALGSGACNLRALDEVLVYDFGGAAGDDFEVFAHEQGADAVMPASVPLDAGPDNLPYADVCGSGEPGKTNAWLLANRGYCTKGKLTPQGAAARVGVYGMTAPITRG